MVAELLTAGSDGFCSLREANPVLKSGAEVILELDDVKMVVPAVDMLGVPNTGNVLLAAKPKLDVVAELKFGREDEVLVVVKGPNAVTVAALVTDTKFGTVTTGRALLNSAIKLKLDEAAVVFNDVPNVAFDPVLANDAKLDVVAPTDSLLLMLGIKLKAAGEAVAFNALPHVGTDPEVLANC